MRFGDVMADSPKTILVLYWSDGNPRPAIRHHLEALKYSNIPHQLIYWNTFHWIPPWMKYIQVDAILLHTTFLCMRWWWRYPEFKTATQWISKKNCLKIALPQDEYDHSEILDEWLYELGVQCIGTNFPQPDLLKILYPIMHTRAMFRHTYTGYIDGETAARVKDTLTPMDRRPLDVVYRAAHLPYWFGTQGQLKHLIADRVNELAPKLFLRTDISTRYEDAITSDQWFSFLASARTTIGTESGSSALDPRGNLKAKIQFLQKSNPDLKFEELEDLLPKGWDDYSFYAISPRHYEAIYTKTVQILMEGEYDGILKPDLHYIPLKRDFSNLTETLEKVRDTKLLNSIAERAYGDIYESGKYTYARLAEILNDFLGSQPERSNTRKQVRGLPLNWIPLLKRMDQATDRIRSATVRYGKRLMGKS